MCLVASRWFCPDVWVFFAALATEDPRPELLLMKPAGRTESLISSKMWKHILTQGIYQMFWLFLILCALSSPSVGSLPSEASAKLPVMLVGALLC